MVLLHNRQKENSLLPGTSQMQLKRAEVLGWSGSGKQFEEIHRGIVDERAIAALIDEDLS